MLIIVLSASNIMIGTRMSYRKLKVRGIPFFTHSHMGIDIHITTLYPLNSTAIPAISGHSDLP